MKLLKKPIIIICATVMLLSIVGLIIGVSISNKPSNVMAKSILTLADDVMEREEIKPITKLLNGGSLECSLNEIKENGNDLLKNTSGSAKVYFSKDALMIDEIEANINGNKMSGSVYISGEEVYVDEKNILGGAYGVNFSTLADDLEESIFASNSRSKYALDDELYDSIIEMLDNSSDNDGIAKDAKKLAKSVGKDLWKIIVDNAEISSERTKIRIDGKRTKVRMITLSIDSDAMEDIIADTCDYLRESDDIIEFLEKYEDSFSLVATELWGEGESIAEAYENFLESIEDEIDELDLSGFKTLEIKVATPKSSKKLLKLEIKRGSEDLFVLDCGAKGIKKTDEIKIEVGGTEISYKIDKNDRRNFDASVTTVIDDEKYEVSLCVGKESGSYKAVYKYEWDSLYYNEICADITTVTGSISASGSTATLTVDKITNKFTRGGLTDIKAPNTIYTLDCEIIIDLNDKMPKPIKDYNTVADITEKDIQAWMKKIAQLL